MTTIAAAEFDEWVEGHTLLQGTSSRPGLLATADGAIIKFFYRKTGWSLSDLGSEAGRFRANGERLSDLGIPAPRVADQYDIPHLRAEAVSYARLDGTDLRASEPDPAQRVPLTQFLNTLHDRGIYFRAIHLGNILRDDNEFKLLDIADLRVYPAALSIEKRGRNLAHLLRDDNDRPRIVALDAGQWLADYEQAAGYTAARRRLLRLVIWLHAGPAGRALLSGLGAPR